MKKTKLFIGVTVLIAIVMSFGCDENKPPVTPTKSDDEKIVETFNDQIKKDDVLNQQEIKGSINSELLISGEIIGDEALKKLLEIAARGEVMKEIKFRDLLYLACPPDQCPCPRGCFDCTEDCKPPLALTELPKLFDNSQVVNPGTILSVKDDVLEVKGQITFEDMPKLIGFLSANKVAKTRLVELKALRKSGN